MFETSLPDGFPIPEFQSKIWAFNSHVHTVIPSQFWKTKPINCKRIEIDTPDNDFLEIDVLDLKNDQPIVALFHGLEGSSERVYIRNLMHDLKLQGLSSAAMNFRGCGSKMNKQPRFYHSGETGDYKLFFNWISASFPGRPIYAVGFSLGANALIKSLGEWKEDHLVERAVAVSPPFDLKRGSYRMHQGFNRLYEYRFLRTLSGKLEQKRASYPDLPTFTGSSIYEFDDQVTAKIHGFNSADHYYDTCSSRLFIKDVKKPLLIIHSKEDTLCPFDYAPLDDIHDNEAVDYIFTRKGGHVGFINKEENWLNRTIIQWFKHR